MKIIQKFASRLIVSARRVMFQKILAILAVASLVLLNRTDYSLAHNESHEVYDEWNPISAGPLTTWTAPLCGKAKFVAQPFLFYNRTRGPFDSDSHYDSLPEGDKKYQYQEQLFLQYGITARLEIDAQTLYQQNYVKQGDREAHSSGFGDSYLFTRYCFIEENGWAPHLAGLLQLKVPTGKYQHADHGKLGTDLMGATSGGGSWDQGIGFILTKKLKPLILHSDFVYSFPQEVTVDGVETKYGNYLNYDFGIEYFLPKGFDLIFEVNGYSQTDRKQDSERTPASDINYLTIAPGLGWSNDKIQVLLGYQRVLIGANTDANDSIVLTCVYTLR